MKKRILAVLLLVITVIITAVFTSCDAIVVPGVNTGTGGTGGDTGSTGGTGNNGNGGSTVPTSYTVTYRYDNTTIFTQTVAAGTALTQEQIVEKNALDVTDFYADTKYKTRFDFTEKITKNTYIYCRKLYNVNYYFNGKVICEQKVDALGGYISAEQIAQANALVYSGFSMSGYYKDKEKTEKFDSSLPLTGDTNIYCQILSPVEYYYADNNEFFFKQMVDFEEGFTEEQIKELNEKLYNGFLLDYYWEDSLKTQEFNFSKKILGETIVYCSRDFNKAGKNVTWRVTADGKTLKFEGEGPMYEYLYVENVPWRMYSTITDIYIEEGITSVADAAFKDFTQISKVTLPETIVKIGSNAFWGSSVSEINFPNSLRVIGKGAFKDCMQLTELLFNPGLELIDHSAFWNCENIVTITLTDTIMEFGINTFKNLNKLRTAYYIGTQEQFNRIDSQIENDWLTDYAHMYYISQEAPAEAGPYWYYDEDGNIKQWYYAIWYMKNDKMRIPCYVDYVKAGEPVTALNIENMKNVTTEGYKFVGWYQKIDEDIIWDSYYYLQEGDMFTEDLELVGDRGKKCGDNLQWSKKGGTLTISKIDKTLDDGVMWDFQWYNSAPWYSNPSTIERVVIEDGVTHIGSNAFYEMLDKNSYYTSFTYIDIPTSVTSISPMAFDASVHLLYVYYAGSKEELANVAGVNEILANDFLPDIRFYSKVDKADFATLGEGAYWCYLEEKGLERRIAWCYEDGKLIVGGGNLYNTRTKLDTEGHNMYDYASLEDTPWYSYRDEITSVVINRNIEYIGTNSFTGMEKVDSIVILSPAYKLSKIAENAFVGTGYYNRMYEEEGVVYVYNEGTTSTTKYAYLIKVNPEKVGEIFIIPDTITHGYATHLIAAGAFEGCTSIKHLVIPNCVKAANIAEGAMLGLTSLEGIYFNIKIGTMNEWVPYQSSFDSTVPVYIFSSIKPTDTETSYWHWNEDGTLPEIWIIEE